MFEIKKPQFEKKEIIPGKYHGTIAQAEVGSTKAGHKTIKMRLKLEGMTGYHFVDLNMEHEKTKQISLDTLSSILYGALVAPPSKLATLQDIALYLPGLPVNVLIKERMVDGQVRYNTYFNDCPNKLQSKEAVSSGTASVNW